MKKYDPVFFFNPEMHTTRLICCEGIRITALFALSRGKSPMRRTKRKEKAFESKSNVRRLDSFEPRL